MRGTRGVLGVAGSLAIGAAVVLGAVSPAVGDTAPIGAFPVWSSGGAGTFDAVFPAASAFPDAHVVTDNSGAGVAAGKSAFLGPATGFGQTFGTSRLQPYLTIGANGLTTPSTTTITFDTPTPVGWSFALGDIDADYVSIVATSGGVPLTSDQLGVRDSAPGSPYLNYCRAATPKPTGCSALDAPYDSFPTWCPTGAGGPCVGKPENTLLGVGTDTSGSYQWFVPTVPVDAVTLTFTPQLGFPSYQLWLVAPTPATTVTGTVEVATDPGEPVPEGVGVALLDENGAPVTDIEDEPIIVPVEPDGTFEFVTGNGDYLLDLVVPEELAPADPELFPLEFTADGTDLNVGTLVVADPTVVVPEPSETPSETPAPAAVLPPTGIDAGASLIIAGVLLVAGIVLAARRRPAGR